MIICQMPCSMPSLLGFWRVLHTLIYCVLHSRTQRGKRISVFLATFCQVSVMPKMRSPQGAAIDVILIQQRTKIHATSVLNNYLESKGHMNATEDTEGPMFLVPSVHCILLVSFLPEEIHVGGCGLQYVTGCARVDCTLKLRCREAEALPGYLTVVLQMLKYFAEVGC